MGPKSRSKSKSNRGNEEILRKKPPIFANSDPGRAVSIYNFLVRDVKGQPVLLEEHRGHPLIITNIALETGLAKWNFMLFKHLYDRFGKDKERGLRILMFPCNQLDKVEERVRTRDYIEYAGNSGLSAEYAYLYGKVRVNCDRAAPLWSYLKKKIDIGKQRFIKNEYTKFVVDRDGVPIFRFDSYVDVEKFTDLLFFRFFEDPPRHVEEENKLDQIELIFLK